MFGIIRKERTGSGELGKKKGKRERRIRNREMRKRQNIMFGMIRKEKTGSGEIGKKKREKGKRGME